VSYSFDPTQSVTANVRRIVAAEVDGAELSLARVQVNGDPLAVHDVRKRTKKLRAVARAVSGSLPRRTWRSVHRAAADAASALGDTRDLQVRHLTLVELIEWAAANPETSVSTDPERFTVAMSHAAAGARQASDVSLADAAQHASWLLTGIAAEVAGWKLADDFGAVAPGVVDTYAKGRRRWRGLVADGNGDPPSPESLHRWRRAVKQRWYHTRLLHLLAPDVLGADSQLLDELGQVLGSDHDLAVLIEALADEPLAWGGASVAVDIAHLAARRRGELTARALFVGRQVYVDPGRVHEARMRAWWKQTFAA
jgi:CHAD domain-containing protein